MKNTIISYANLSRDLKAAFSGWLNIATPDLISFPFQGKHLKGYIFNHGEKNYLVVMKLHHTDDQFNPGYELIDINVDF